MTLKKYIPISFTIACIAAVLQCIDQALGQGPLNMFAGFGWVSFQAWAMYFLAGCDIKGAGKVFVGYFLGIVASIFIFTVGGALGGLGFWCMPVTLVITVTIIMCLELTPYPFSFTAALFVGAGVFFCMCSYMPACQTGWDGYLLGGGVELLYCFLGLVCGWLTVAFRSWYEPKYVKKDEK
jgi:hypothetical protein